MRLPAHASATIKTSSQVRAVPGVRAAGTINRFPLHDGTLTTAVVVDGDPPPPPGLAPTADYRIASAGYFRAMGISVLAGRDFTSTDNTDSTAQLVAIVNETAARTLLHATNPVGKRVGLGGSNRPLFTVVGVVRDVHDASSPRRSHARADLPAVAATGAAERRAVIVVHHDGHSRADRGHVRAPHRAPRSTTRVPTVRRPDHRGRCSDKASVGDRFPMVLLCGLLPFSRCCSRPSARTE